MDKEKIVRELKNSIEIKNNLYHKYLDSNLDLDVKQTLMSMCLSIKSELEFFLNKIEEGYYD